VVESIAVLLEGGRGRRRISLAGYAGEDFTELLAIAAADHDEAPRLQATMIGHVHGRSQHPSQLHRVRTRFAEQARWR